MSNFAGHGGSYRVDESGQKTQVEAPTEDHKDGNAPRDHEGRRLDRAPAASAAAPAPETTPPARKRGVLSVLSGDNKE